jgi:hypothetical protein
MPPPASQCSFLLCPYRTHLGERARGRVHGAPKGRQSEERALEDGMGVHIERLFSSVFFHVRGLCFVCHHDFDGGAISMKTRNKF